MDPRFEPKTDFGNWIIAKKKTASQTAALIGVTRSYVWLLATGRKVPSMKLAAKIQACTLGEVAAGSWVAPVRKL